MKSYFLLKNHYDENMLALTHFFMSEKTKTFSKNLAFSQVKTTKNH
ncbi:hypothetical protein HMPREF1243_0103 [Streptococcus pyogenes GA03747]|nr:hypothetical protein HMPREF1243_0103 [Streptococcus pyogenes GA03747]